MRKYLLILLLFVSTVSFSQIDDILTSLENYQIAKLDNGMKVIVVNTEKYIDISYRFILDFKPFYQDKVCGSTEIMAQMMGAELVGKTQIVKEMISAQNAVDSLLDFMSGVLLRPVFKDSILNPIKVKKLYQFNQTSKNYDSLLLKYGRYFNFTENHPYNEQNTIQSISNITPAELKKIHTKIFIPANAILVITGDVDIEGVLPYVQKYFSAWIADEPEEVDYVFPEIEESKIIFYNDNSLSKSYISLTYPVKFNISKSNYLAACVLSNMFLKSKSGIIYENIVTDKKHSEDLLINFSSDPYLSMFSINALVDEDNVSDFFEELNTLLTDVDNLSTSPHFQQSKLEIISDFEKSFINPNNVCRYAYNLEKYNLSKTFYTDYTKDINKITQDKLASAAKDYFLPNNANYIIIGNRDELFCPFQKLALDYQIEQSYDTTLVLIYEKGFGAQTIINNYLKESNAELYFSDLSIYFDAIYYFDNDTITLKGNTLRKNENLFRYSTQKIEDSVTVLIHQIEIYDGKKWLDSTINYRKVFANKEISSRMYKTYLFPEKYFDKINYLPYLVCDKVLFGKNIYKIIVKTPEEVEFQEYYDIITKQKIKTEKLINDNLIETYEYFDYQKLESSVTIPMKIIQSSKNYKIELIITKIDSDTKLKISDFKINEK